MNKSPTRGKYMGNTVLTIYKIRRNADGLYSTGGSSPKFNHSGKSWAKRGHVSNHLSMFTNKEKFYKDCEVVCYEVCETEIESMSVSEWGPTEKTIRSYELKERRRQEYEIERKKREIARLEESLAKLRKSS
jgi:hypothetical protein